jgi:aryl sulfotransferase
MLADPRLLVLGYPKCGNVWLRGLMADLLKASGADFRQIMQDHPMAPALEAMDLGIKDQARQDQIRFEPLRAYQDIPAVFTWAIPDIHAYAAATSMAHSHSAWRPETDELIRAFSHRVLIVRDPRDVAVSWSRWIFTPFNRLHRPTVHATAEALLVDDLPRRVTEWAMHQQSWLQSAAADLSLHVVFYEQLVDNTPRELGRIARYLGLEVAAEALEQVATQHALGEMKKRQPHHVFRGGWGSWLEHLDDRQIHTAQRACGPMMKLLGYPLNRADSAGWTPDQLRAPERSVGR